MIKKLTVSLLLPLLISSCAYTQQQSAADPNAPLYERLGGKEAIFAVVERMTEYVARDERINGFFVGADLERVNAMLTEQICEASGGPCTYTGGDMISVHTGMNITETQFNALVEDLIRSLNDFRVPEREQKELLQLLGSMQEEIVDR